LSEAILRYGRFTPFKKEQDAILALFKGTQNVVFLKEHVGHSFGRGTPRYSPDFHHPFKKPIIITTTGDWIPCQIGHNKC
jgi:hypothetical protein